MLTILLQSGLFLWFIASLYFVAKDTTFSYEMKLLGEIINLLCLGYIAANMSGENSGVLFWSLGILLLMWYFYFTPQDMGNPGYKPIEKYVYVAIDIAMIIYLISSLTISIANKTFTSTYNMVHQLEQFRNIGFHWI